MNKSYRKERMRMVKNQLEERGITVEAVLNAFRSVPREKFVRSDKQNHAYEDRALPSKSGQTISQPYMVAIMTQCLSVEKNMKILEIGTGTGYQTAVLVEMGGHVYTVERHQELTEQAKTTLNELGYSDQVRFRVGDGTLGWNEHAPYDRIIVTAGAPDVPNKLKNQLKIGGRIVIPVGNKDGQTIKILRKIGQDEWETDESVSCVFVPLKGDEGWEIS